jgi:CBS domain-containing protein
MMNGQVLGIITLQPVWAIPKERREIETVEQTITHCEPTETVGPAITALDRFNRMSRENVEAVFVLEDSQLTGVVARGARLERCGQGWGAGCGSEIHESNKGG